MSDSKTIIDEYEGWLVSRSLMLVRAYHVDYDDAFQELSVGLLQWESQKTAWLSAKKFFEKQKRDSFVSYADPDWTPDRQTPESEESVQREYLEQFDLSEEAEEVAILMAKGFSDTEIVAKLEIDQIDLLDLITEINSELG